MSNKPKGTGIRLDKYLTDTMGITRSEARNYIKKGQVSVGETVCRDAGMKINAQTAEVTCCGRQLTYQKYHYYMLHKPGGVVSATKDSTDRTVLDLIREPVRDLFPVGRLDKDTEGLLLITDDGDLAHQLLSPKKHVDKCYFARLDQPAKEEDIQAFAQGIDIGEKKPTLPGRLEIDPDDPTEVRITIREGKFHQIKRMMHALGHEVIYLKRISMGGLMLDNSLAPGEYRPLTEDEIKKLQELTHG